MFDIKKNNKGLPSSDWNRSFSHIITDIDLGKSVISTSYKKYFALNGVKIFQPKTIFLDGSKDLRGTQGQHLM